MKRKFIHISQDRDAAVCGRPIMTSCAHLSKFLLVTESYCSGVSSRGCIVRWVRRLWLLENSPEGRSWYTGPGQYWESAKWYREPPTWKRNSDLALRAFYNSDSLYEPICEPSRLRRIQEVNCATAVVPQSQLSDSITNVSRGYRTGVLSDIAFHFDNEGTFVTIQVEML